MAPGTAGDEGAAASAGLRAASMLSPAAHSSSAVAARWLLAEAEAEAAALRAAAVAEAERVRSDAAKAVEETAASAERSRRQGVARTAELASGQMNVARSVLSAELRILDEDIREEQEAEWERVARRQREAEAEADRLLAAAEEKAVHVLAEARKAAEAAAEEERKRLMESVAADASREAEAARDLAMHQFHATRMLLSDELRVLDEEARERREEEEEKEQARRRQEEEARVRKEEEEEEARRRRSSAEKAAVPSSSSSSSPQSAAKVEVADAHFRSARRLLSDELRILDEEARDKREAEEEQARVKARQEEAERRREAEALRARASDEARAVREQAEKEAAEMLRRAEEEARRLSASPAVPPPRVEHTTCAKDGRWGEPSLPTAGGPSYSPGVNPGFTTSNDEDVTAAEEDEDEGGVSALPSPQVLPAPMGGQCGGPRPAVPTLASSPSGALHPVYGSPSVRGLETTDLDRAFGQTVCGRGSTKVPATRQRLASSSTSPRRSASIHV